MPKHILIDKELDSIYISKKSILNSSKNLLSINERAIAVFSSAVATNLFYSRLSSRLYMEVRVSWRGTLARSLASRGAA